MTLAINDVTRIKQYTATGGQTSFAIPFEFYSVDEIVVYNNGALLTYSLTPTAATEYSVTGVGVELGGSITLGAPGATVSDIVTIVSSLPIERLTDFPISGPFQIDQLNEELDKFTIMLQQLDTYVTERMLLMEDFDEPEVLGRLPVKAVRANKTLGFDANGNPTVSDGTLSGALIDYAGITPAADTVYYYNNGTTLTAITFNTNVVTFIEDLANLSDPGVDSVIFWNDTTNTFEWKSVSALITEAGLPSTREFAGATDTLVLADAGNVVHSTGASAAVITVPPLSSVTWVAGSYIEVKQVGTGSLSLTAGVGVTIESFGNVYTLAGQNAVVGLRYEGSNVWSLAGELQQAGPIQDLIDLTFAQGDVLYHDGTDLVNLAPGTSGQFLQTLGAAENPAWADLGIGTGVQAYDAVLADLAGITFAQGDILYYNGTNLVKLAVGTNGQYLQTLGAAANPAWADVEAGGSAPVQTEAGDYTITTVDDGDFIRMTNASTKTVTIPLEATEALPADGEWNFRNDGAGLLTIAPAGGVTVNLPTNGSLTVPEGGTFTLKRVAEDEFDLFGVTGAATAETQSIIIACSDETTALTTGTAKVTLRMPYAFTLTAVRASVTTAPTDAVLTVDINETATTILSTKLTIDATEKTSTTAATAAVISDTALADDAEITIDIDTVGSTIAGAGLKVYLIGYRT